MGTAGGTFSDSHVERLEYTNIYTAIDHSVCQRTQQVEHRCLLLSFTFMVEFDAYAMVTCKI